jgi:hypothetical protein
VTTVPLVGLTIHSEDGGLSPRDQRVIPGAQLARLLAFAEATYPSWQGWLEDREALLRLLRGTRDLVAALSYSERSMISDWTTALDALEELITVLHAKLEASIYSEHTLAQRYTVTIQADLGPGEAPRGAA